MANYTYSAMFQRIADQIGLTNTFSDGLSETRSIKQDINQIQKEILTLSKTYLKKYGVSVGNTVANQANYAIPATVDKISSIKVTVSSQAYYPQLISIDAYHELTKVTTSSTIPLFFTIDKAQIYIYPTPSANGNAIEANSNIFATDLNVDPSASTDTATALEVKQGFENLIYYYCLSQAYYRIINEGMGDRYRDEFKILYKEFAKDSRNPTNSIVIGGGTRIINPNDYPTLSS